MSLEWMARASCVGMDPELFFPEGDDPDGDEARDVCSLCPVAAECLKYALGNNLDHGVFGGFLPRQRAKMRPENKSCAICGVAITVKTNRMFCRDCAAHRRRAQYAEYDNKTSGAANHMPERHRWQQKPRPRMRRISEGSGPAVTAAQGIPLPLSPRAVS